MVFSALGEVLIQDGLNKLVKAVSAALEDKKATHGLIVVLKDQKDQVLDPSVGI